MNKLLVYSCLIFILGCSNYPDSVEESLLLAGDNRKELIAVLDHYQHDSLKYRAALFLVDHMKWHFSNFTGVEIDPKYDSCYSDIDLRFNILSEGRYLRDLSSPEMRSFFARQESYSKKLLTSQSFQKTKLLDKYVPDVSQISKTFLIKHIDNAFKLRETNLYVKKMSFESFCNYILPYRSCRYEIFTNGKQLNDMFAKYMAKGSNFIDKMKWYNAYVFRMKCLYGKSSSKETTGIYDLFYGKHDCVGVASHCTDISRACGIPMVTDYITSHRYFFSRHYFSSVLSGSNHWISFTPEQDVLGEFNFQAYTGLNTLRFTYAAQKNSPYFLKNSDEQVPNIFNDPCISEVTHLYKNVSPVKLRVPSTTNRLAYLAVFEKGREGLAPATWGEIDSMGHVTYRNVIYNTFYFPMLCHSEHNDYFASPFWLASAGDVHYLDELLVDSDTSSNMTVYRKFPWKENMKKNATATIGAKLYGANRSDFSDRICLLTIDDTLQPYVQDFLIPFAQYYKYYQYVTVNKQNSNISVLELLALEDTDKLSVEQATPKTRLTKHDVDDFMKYKEVSRKQMPWSDHNMKTSSGSRKEIRLELPSKQRIVGVRIAPVNADNGIVVGDRYQLLYWDNGWQELDIQDAIANYLEFKNIPKQKLYWLKNLTQGREEYPFIMRNGKQLFIHHDLVTSD